MPKRIRHKARPLQRKRGEVRPTSGPGIRAAHRDKTLSVSFRTATDRFDLKWDAVTRKSFALAAMEWTYIVGSRQRWSITAESLNRQALAAAELLRDFGIESEMLARLANAGVVEVSIPWTDEATGWESRIFPWEHVLGTATRNLRAGAPITILRHLYRQNASAIKPTGPINRVLFVASEPGPLRDRYSFDTERELVRTHLKVSDANWRELASPTVDQLRIEVNKFRPDVVHLAGFDTHQAQFVLLGADPESAARLEENLDSRRDSTELKDGYVMAGAREYIQSIDPNTLGQSLAPSGHRPRLVSFNIWNSAARIAPMVVADGATSAIGFQDTFADDFAELFFSVLYSTWRQTDWQLAHAFRSAWEAVREQGDGIHGTGVVCWSAVSHYPDLPSATAKKTQPRLINLIKLQEVLERKPISADSVKANEVRDWITVSVKPVEDFNYSLLHNQRSLFEHFILTRKNSGSLRDVRVKVALFVGGESAVYEQTFDLDSPSIDLRRKICVPLTSSLTRSVHESIRTSLSVEVTWGAHVLHQQTYSVRLLPVDQWQDTPVDRIWLPSFVFPRDPAVARLIDTAQRYVRVLRDDPAAGFDGYQSFDPRNPETQKEIDLQVQAIWSAVVHELRLSYINPPPSYSRQLDSQRLRTPSMVASTKCGTCIDLALFFASCLELVDIYPVIFLLKEHAFPGYWRSDKYHDEFAQARPKDIEDIVRADSRATAVAGAQRESWFLGPATFREIVQLVNAGRLVPIETVRLTENCGFAEAIDSGRDNLRAQRDFDALVDVALARQAQVTPLPIWGEQI